MHPQTKKIIRDIQLLRIQGATNIVKSSIQTLIFLLSEIPTKNVKKYSNMFLLNALALSQARPTEPYAQNLFLFLKMYLQKNSFKNINDLKFILKYNLNLFLEDLKNSEFKIVKNGEKIIKSNMNVLTHCHSSSVENIFLQCHKEKKHFKVFSDETRPLFQGRITAQNLNKAGINVTQIADSASGFLISPYSGKDLMIDIILVGADAIRLDGSIVNKIGTYDIAASAYLNKTPFYVAASLLKIDIKNTIKIEKRSDKELWPHKPKKIKILNFAFDQVPAKFITGIITEFGILSPAKVKKTVKQKYSWLK
jgi:eIF-2B alpha/beta/delta-like uncharacterized protein